MNSVNRVSLAGNLTRDPELRKTPNGSSVTELGLALNRSWTGPNGEKNEEVTYVDISAWGKTAENVAQYLSKGSAVFIEGRLKLDQWQDAKTNEPRSKLRVVAERVHFLDPPGTSQSRNQGQGRASRPQESQPAMQ
jgi:single-strand DNA-binding protein